MLTVDAWLKQATQALQASSSSAKLDSDLLLSHVLNCRRSQLWLRAEQSLTEDQQTQAQALLQRRLLREPIAYILGHKEFWSLTLAVNPAVLIPRPETEHLVETALRLIPNPQASLLDLGTGSGAIALACAQERPRWRIVAGDISPAALAVAQRNAQALKLHNIDFRQGSWLEVAQAGECFDAIVSNPPYLAEDDTHLVASEISHEPRLALVADHHGLAAYQTIVAQASDFLKVGGYLMFEHGAEQAQAIQQLLEQAGFHAITTSPDLSGLERITYGQRG